MPPINKITKEMIVNAGKEIIKLEGVDRLNVRKIASKLNCSTQPIMYHYKTVNELKSDIYIAVDEYHSKYITEIADCNKINPMLGIGLRYIMFAVKEKNYFKFLFQTDKFSNLNFNELIEKDSEELSAIYEILQHQANITKEQSKMLFANLFITVHGLASLLANNSMKYDEKYCINILENTFYGVINKIKGEK